MAVADDRIGALLLRDHIITQVQLDHALQVQKEQEVRERLGTILVQLGYLTYRGLRALIRRYGKRKPLGELLVGGGVLSREQLAASLEAHRTAGVPLGRILVGRGILDDDKLAQALSRQLDIPYVVPQSNLVDMKVFNRLPERFVQAHSVIPLFESEGVVTVVVADPADLNVMYQLEDAFGSNLELAMCSKARIDSAIEVLLRQKRLGAATERPEVGGRRAAAGERLVLSPDNAVIQGAGVGGGGTLDYLIYNALQEGASDVHIETERDRLRVRYRVDGVLLLRTELPTALAVPLITRAKVLAGLDTRQARQQVEGRILAQAGEEQVDLRLTISPSVFGESVSIRVFSRTKGLMDLEDLGLLPESLASYKRLIRRGSGMTLFCGPAGTGKTTSLYATLNLLSDGSCKIVTAETPVECAIAGIVQNQLANRSPEVVVSAVRSLLSQDPDIVALGETTTLEAAGALLEAALSGHRVFSTMLAEDSASAIVRLQGARAAAPFLASCSLVIVAQRLVRVLCHDCREVYVPSLEVVQQFHVRDFDPDATDMYRGRGCAECLGTGFRGRTGIFELAVVDPGMYDLLPPSRSADQIRHAIMVSPSFVSLAQVGFLKAVQGVTTLEEVLRVLPSVELQEPEAQRHTLADLCERTGLPLEGRLTRERDEMA